jgi:MFS family permease
MCLIAGDLADVIGLRTTIISGCIIYSIGVISQMFANKGLAPIVVGRIIAGLGVGFVSGEFFRFPVAGNSFLTPNHRISSHYHPLHVRNLSPKDPRSLGFRLPVRYHHRIDVGGHCRQLYQGPIRHRTVPNSHRYPVRLGSYVSHDERNGAKICSDHHFSLGTGLFFLPESPRYFVKRGRLDRARNVLARLRGQDESSPYIESELAEIVANAEYEKSLMPSTTWFGQWAACFSGSVFSAKSNLRRTILGTSLQMMQQWTGVNFIFYYSTTFLKSTGAITDPFLTSMIFTIVNVCSTPISFYTVEKFGRRPLLIWGALGC